MIIGLIETLYWLVMLCLVALGVVYLSNIHRILRAQFMLGYTTPRDTEESIEYAGGLRPDETAWQGGEDSERVLRGGQSAGM